MMRPCCGEGKGREPMRVAQAKKKPRGVSRAVFKYSSVAA
jgi:hypothetical protein